MIFAKNEDGPFNKSKRKKENRKQKGRTLSTFYKSVRHEKNGEISI